MVSFGFFQVQARKQRRREDSLLPTPLIVLSSSVIHLSRSSATVLQGAGGFESKTAKCAEKFSTCVVKHREVHLSFISMPE